MIEFLFGVAVGGACVLVSSILLNQCAPPRTPPPRLNLQTKLWTTVSGSSPRGQNSKRRPPWLS